MKFLDKVANHVRENEYKHENLTIILPSERAIKYMASALYNAYNKPLISPKMITMDRWVKSYSSKGIIDQTRSLIELFKVQLKNAKTEEDKSFDEFISWGTTLLSDFNEIDRYLLDADQVFKNLADIKEIEQWSFERDKLTESQERFMEFWDRLPGYYKELAEALNRRQSCYVGLAYKEIAENIQVLFNANKNQRFLFVGLNALSTSEKALITQLEKLGRAEVLIDADEYYYRNKAHEAGRFLRDLSSTLGGKKLDFVTNKLVNKALNVQLIECAQNTGQTKVAATILNKLSKEQLDETLLLLADESLIGSVIKNLPENIGKANITLGLPIRNTAVRTWVDLIFSIQENKKRYKTKSIHFSDLQRFWNHPFLLAIIDKEERESLRLVEQTIIQQNRIFLNPNPIELKRGDAEHRKLGELTQQLLDLITHDWKDTWPAAMKTIRELNQLIYPKLSSEFAFEKASIERFDQSLIDLENIVNEGVPDMSLKSFKHLFNQHWGNKSIAYHGNPMDGLQIMGLLETRGLDFKRIICLGMNEGKLPPTNPTQTMIPMDLRRYLGLPLPSDKQGLFAHHFYRLLHHCEDLIVTYSTAEESFGSSEPSRYLMQLEMELSRINPNLHLSKSIYSLEENQVEKFRSIPKSPEILERLDQLLSNSVSASMLKKYISCPLDFYFRYAMDFGEQDEVEEEIEHSTFGTFIHDTLEELYSPYARFDKEGNEVHPKPPNITSVDIEVMLKNFLPILDKQFLRHFHGDKEAFTKGKNLLSYQMAIELTERFLKSEIAFLSAQSQPVFILSLERAFHSMIEIEVHGKIKKIHLRGFIDRIDQVGNQIRIIDYKTGKVDAGDVKIAKAKNSETEAEDVVNAFKKKHVLQLIQYAYLYYKETGIIPQSSIISFVSNKNEPFELDTNHLSLEEVIKNYPEYLTHVFEEMYDEQLPFVHEGNAFNSFCQYCS